MDGRLVLHRWAQWISAFHSGGVYDGEEGNYCHAAGLSSRWRWAHALETAGDDTYES